MTQSYDIGDKPRLSVAFSDYQDTATDPTAITFICIEPDGVSVSYVYATDSELVKDNVGNYHVDYSIKKQGRHTFKFVGTGTVESTERSEFYARANG